MTSECCQVAVGRVGVVAATGSMLWPMPPSAG